MDALNMTLEESQDPAKLEEAVLGLAQWTVKQEIDDDNRAVQLPFGIEHWVAKTDNVKHLTEEEEFIKCLRERWNEKWDEIYGLSEMRENIKRFVDGYRQKQTARDLAEECGEDNEIQE